MAARPPSALWLYRKPPGVTSASLVDGFRQAHAGPWTLKVSHGGVLDPFASGLVVVLVGAANRLFEALHEVPKRYVATIEWGRETTTGDAGGVSVPLVDQRRADQLSAAEVEASLSRFIGWTEQVPPATSNKRVGGERAYEKAHRGEVVTLPAQRVYLHHAAWRSHELPQRSVLELSVRGGFYVRSLATDLGRVLGVGAHLSALERTAIGPWETPVEAPRMITGREVLPWLPSIELSDAEWGVLRAGGGWPERKVSAPTWLVPEGFPPPSGVRFLHQGRLVALQRGGDVVMLPGGI
ncbi:MAG: tRNA pseudouridine(55) synthase [Myxococcaceae bacterium]